MTRTRDANGQLITEEHHAGAQQQHTLCAASRQDGCKLSVLYGMHTAHCLQTTFQSAAS